MPNPTGFANTSQKSVTRHKYLFLSGYLTYQLTGQFVDSVGGQVGYVPFDAKKLDWAASSDWKWQAISLDRAMLPDLVAPASQLGEISSLASTITGIPTGLPLSAAAADRACEVIGSGCLEPSIGCLSYGTTATFTTIQPDYLEVIPPLPPFPAAIPGAYNPVVIVNRGYWMVNWFKEQFGYEEQIRASKLNIEIEQLFECLLTSVPPGSMGLMLQPYWSPGVKVPSQEAKGAIIGFGDVHTRAHLYCAILEGMRMHCAKARNLPNGEVAFLLKNCGFRGRITAPRCCDASGMRRRRLREH
jgi:sugar (pentulose or hexulose) kinase